MEVDPAQLEGILEAVTGWGAGLFVLGCVILLFRSTIENVVAGILFKRGAELTLDQTVLISGRFARLVRVGVLKTVFYMENGVESKMIVPNSQLVQLTLEVRLAPHKASASEAAGEVRHGSGDSPMATGRVEISSSRSSRVRGIR